MRPEQQQPSIPEWQLTSALIFVGVVLLVWLVTRKKSGPIAEVVSAVVPPPPLVSVWTPLP